MTTCPTCHTPNRPTARFCVKCGTKLAAVSQAANVGAPAASPHTPVMTPAVALPNASQAVTPSQQTTSQAGNFANTLAHGIKRVLYFIGRGLTLGGRAAYTDLFAPQEIARGQVITIDRRAKPALFEMGFGLWLVAWIAFGLILLLPSWWSIVAYIALYVILLVLALTGWRFLGLSRLSVDTLVQFFRAFKPITQPHTQFTLQTAQGQVVVILRGVLRGAMNTTVAGKPKCEPFNDAAQTLDVNHLVRVWGMYEGHVLRAWQVEFLQLNGVPAQVWLRAPRVLPLTAALLIPLTFWFAIKILLLILP